MENATTTNPMLRVIKIRNFRLLWLGGAISVLGSQFSMIAMPWLVLQLTGDPLALGIVLALAGIPRAIFILIGGTATDRFSARNILLACDWINFGLTLLAGVLVYANMMEVWMLYILSLITGLLAGFVIPAANSIVPNLVPGEDLQAGNSITMGSSQLAGFVGPALAGIIIGSYAQSSLGIVIAFFLDALTFAVSALLLWGIRMPARPAQTAQAASGNGKETIWQSIRTALAYLFSNPGLRLMFIIIAAVNFLFTGPLLVGIPVLADQRLAEGAQAFGFLMSGYAGGNFLGLILAGSLPKPSATLLSRFTIILLAGFGTVLTAMGWINNTWIDAALMFVLGTGNGYLSIVMFTWIQTRTPRDMLGRVMSIVMLANMGLTPLSQAISGAISRWSLTALFTAAGGLILLTAAWAIFQPALKGLGADMAGSPAKDQMEKQAAS